MKLKNDWFKIKSKIVVKTMMKIASNKLLIIILVKTFALVIFRLILSRMEKTKLLGKT